MSPNGKGEEDILYTMKTFIIILFVIWLIVPLTCLILSDYLKRFSDELFDTAIYVGIGIPVIIILLALFLYL